MLFTGIKYAGRLCGGFNNTDSQTRPLDPALVISIVVIYHRHHRFSDPAAPISAT